MTDESWALNEAARLLDDPGVASRLWATGMGRRMERWIASARRWWELKDASERLTWLIVASNFALVIFAALLQALVRWRLR